MKREIPERYLEREGRLHDCKTAIYDIVRHGKYTCTPTVEVTEFTTEIEDMKICVYDSFSYISGEGGPAYGVSVEYKDQSGEQRSDWLGFTGYDEVPEMSFKNVGHRTTTDNDVEMFAQLLGYLKTTLGEATTPAEVWRNR